ncbi:carbohydrate-binding protein [Maribellus sediminis]|uniref:carbohydrate-binding protein n=1 Tax=Maribellus sediminis TaxID=2696285 RepID=UPI00142FA23A|nr:carbohydrate-binding protein [Maribellus sediminis]
MTSQGAGPPLNAFGKIDAERACQLFGNVRIEQFEQANEKLGEIQNGDNVAYKYVDFKDGADEIKLRVKALKNGGTFIIKLDQPWGPNAGELTIPGRENAEWEIVSAKIKKVEGIHSVWFTFQGKDKEMYDLDWFEFSH